MAGPLGVRDEVLDKSPEGMADRLTFIEQYDLEFEKAQAVQSGADADYIDTIAWELKRFLALPALYTEEQFAPALAVDLLWHVFLESPGYADFCATAYGAYLRHEPTGPRPDAPGEDPLFVATMARMHETFVEFDPGPWETYVRACVGCISEVGDWPA